MIKLLQGLSQSSSDEDEMESKDTSNESRLREKEDTERPEASSF